MLIAVLSDIHGNATALEAHEEGLSRFDGRGGEGEARRKSSWCSHARAVPAISATLNREACLEVEASDLDYSLRIGVAISDEIVVRLLNLGGRLFRG